MYADPTLMDLAAAYAKRRNGRKTKHAVACDRPGAKAKMGRILQSYEVDELKEFLEAYGIKTYDIIKSIGQVKVPKSQQGKALDAIAALNREIRKDGIGGSVVVDVVPFDRPGAKAKFANDWHGKRVTNNAGKIFLVQRSAAGYDLYAMDSGKKAKSMTQDQMDEAARSGKFRDVFSRPSAKAKMAVHAGVLAQAQANVRRAEKDYAEAKERLEAMIRYDHPEARIAQAERGVELAEKRLEEAEKALRSLHSRPGAKAKMGRAEDIYRKLSSGSVTLANAKEWERLAVEALRLPDFTPAGTDWSLHELAEEIGAEVLALKSRASRPGAKAKSTHAALPPQTLEAERKPGGGSHSEAVSRKIATLINEGKPQDQAVAIALDLERRGEL